MAFLVAVAACLLAATLPGTAWAANIVQTRGPGPVESCQVLLKRQGVLSPMGTGTAGQFTLPDGVMAESVISDSASLSCTDTFSDTAGVLLSAVYPPTAGEPDYASAVLTASVATTAVAGYMSLSTYTGDGAWSDVDDALNTLYTNLALDYQPPLSGLPPAITLQPLLYAQMDALDDRALGVGLCAVESQLSAYLSLGNCLLTAALPGLNATAANSYLAEQLFSSAAATAAAGAVRGTLSVLSFVTGALTDAMAGATVTWGPTLNATERAQLVTAASAFISETSAVITGMADLEGGPLRAANAVMAGALPVTGMNVMEEFMQAARLKGVQAEACVAVTAFVGGDTTALQPFTPSQLSARMLAIEIDEPAILGALGLSVPAAPQATTGVVATLGPVYKCTGVEDGLFAPGSGSFSTDRFGVYQMSNRQLGTLYVDAQAGCMDLLTNLRLPFSLSSFSVSAAQLAVNPIAMLAEGFYLYAASLSPVMPAANLQELAFQNMGINMSQYLAVLPPPGQAGTVVLYPNNTVVQPSNASYVATPISVATSAAVAQISSLFLSSIALFMPSALILADNNHLAAEYLVLRATVYSFAREVAVSGSVQLTSAAAVERILDTANTVLYIDSSGLPPEPKWYQQPPPTPPPRPPAPSPAPPGAGSGRRHALSSESDGDDAGAAAGAASAAAVSAAASMPAAAVLPSEAVTDQSGSPGRRRGRALSYADVAASAAAVAMPRPAVAPHDHGAALLITRRTILDAAARIFFEGDGAGGDARAVAIAARRSGGRSLSLFTDNLDMVDAIRVFSSVVASASYELQFIKSAFLLLPSGYNSSTATGPIPVYQNQTACNVNGCNTSVALAQLTAVMWNLQANFFPAAVRALEAGTFNSNTIAALFAAYGQQEDWTPVALQDKGLEAKTNWFFICSITYDCPTIYPAPVSAGGSSTLVLALGVGLGVGIPLVILLGWLLYHFCSERRVVQTVSSKNQAAYMGGGMGVGKGGGGYPAAGGYGSPGAYAGGAPATPLMVSNPMGLTRDPAGLMVPSLQGGGQGGVGGGYGYYPQQQQQPLGSVGYNGQFAGTGGQSYGQHQGGAGAGMLAPLPQQAYYQGHPSGIGQGGGAYSMSTPTRPGTLIVSSPSTPAYSNYPTTPSRMGPSAGVAGADAHAYAHMALMGNGNGSQGVVGSRYLGMASPTNEPQQYAAAAGAGDVSQGSPRYAGQVMPGGPGGGFYGDEPSTPTRAPGHVEAAGLGSPRAPSSPRYPRW
ncbi:hypothetical protein FOA52_008861 [Chlamydomonas sp. UWO 241]|nr:hypothetical protein FOA52_008861 [Chlamydomonas sp. UWO 241]